MKKLLVLPLIALLASCGTLPTPAPAPAPAPTTVETASLTIKVGTTTSVATLKAGAKPVVVCAADRRYTSAVCDNVYDSETLYTGSDYGATFTEHAMLTPASPR